MIGIGIAGCEGCRAGGLLGEERVGVFAGLRNERTTVLVDNLYIRVRGEGFLERSVCKRIKAGRHEMDVIRQTRK